MGLQDERNINGRSDLEIKKKKTSGKAGAFYVDGRSGQGRSVRWAQLLKFQINLKCVAASAGVALHVLHTWELDVTGFV